MCDVDVVRLKEPAKRREMVDDSVTVNRTGESVIVSNRVGDRRMEVSESDPERVSDE